MTTLSFYVKNSGNIFPVYQRIHVNKFYVIIGIQNIE